MKYEVFNFCIIFDSVKVGFGIKMSSCFDIDHCIFMSKLDQY